MRKKILLFIFSLILSFVFLDNLYAREIKICTYKLSSKQTTITLNIVDGKVAKQAHYLRESSNKDNRQIDVANGQKALKGSSFVGDEYYKKNKSCPPYIVLTSSNTGKYLYLSDEKLVDSKGNDTELAKAIKNEYSTLDKGYPFALPLNGTEEQQKEEKDWENSLAASCMAFTTEQECRNGYKKGQEDAELKFSCLWVENEFGSYCNVNKSVYVTCGGAYDIPYEAPKIISFFVYLLKIATPIILIFFSVIPLVKALASSNEDELKKAQKSLIKKLIAAALVFFVVSIVQFVIMKVADISETNNISDCFDCFLNNNCESTAYYKTNVGGTYLCKQFSGTVYSCDGN